MPHLLRHGRATVAVAALFAGAPPLVPGVAPLVTEMAVAEPASLPAPAPARQVPPSESEVVFGGDRLLGIRCRARLEAATLTVPAETTVKVVNRTSRRAVLVLDGVPRGEIPHGGSARVLFHHGPVSVELRPICVFSAGATLRVEVGPAEFSAGTADPWAPSAARPGAAEGFVPGLGWGGRAAAEATGGEPVRDRGPTGLLALVAAVCVVGVSAGAIRAINAQRATWTAVS